jgi:3-deoxy-D-manno-octulosonic-acid transferase
VIFGDHYKKNPEADDLIAAGGGKSFSEEYAAADFVLFLLNNEEELQEMSGNARKFIKEKPDATNLILQKILS